MDSPQLKTLLEHAGERYIFKDLRQVITGASASFLALYDSHGRPDELIGRTEFDVLPCEIARLHDRLEQKVLAGAPSARAIRPAVDAQGRATFVETDVYPVSEGAGIIGLLIVERYLATDESEPSGQPEAESSRSEVERSGSSLETPQKIRAAMAAGEFVLFYQPRVNMSTGKVIGAEALLQWQQPKRGVLLPSTFIPAIEDAAVLAELADWIIENALTQMEQWIEAGLDLQMSVHVGERELQATDFVDRLSALMAAHPSVHPSHLQLEMLESCAPKNVERLRRVMAGCCEIGVSFVLEDFGASPLSLADFKQSLASQCKLHSSFVREILEKPEELSILEGLLSLVFGFGRQPIADGVETIEQGLMLLRLGCEMGQGACIAAPMSAEEFPTWMAHWSPDSRWTEAHSVASDDRPLLYAGAEHRAWIQDIEAFLKGQTSEQPPTGRHQCRFGSWLDVESQGKRSTLPEFQAVTALHWRLHALATGIVKLQSQGKAAEGIARLAELYSLHQKMEVALKALTPKPRQVADEHIADETAESTAPVQ